MSNSSHLSYLSYLLRDFPDRKLHFSPRCEEFAKRNCTVYATARNLESMDGLLASHANIRLLQLEVTSDESVQRAVDGVIANEGRIDVLVNNAGVICIGVYSQLFDSI